MEGKEFCIHLCLHTECTYTEHTVLSATFLSNNRPHMFCFWQCLLFTSMTEWCDNFFDYCVDFFQSSDKLESSVWFASFSHEPNFSTNSHNLIPFPHIVFILHFWSFSVYLKQPRNPLISFLHPWICWISALISEKNV